MSLVWGTCEMRALYSVFCFCILYNHTPPTPPYRQPRDLENPQFPLEILDFDALELFPSQEYYWNRDDPMLEILKSGNPRTGNIEITTLRSRKFWNPMPETTKLQSQNWNSRKGSAELWRQPLYNRHPRPVSDITSLTSCITSVTNWCRSRHCQNQRKWTPKSPKFGESSFNGSACLSSKIRFETLGTIRPNKHVHQGLT